MSDFVLFAGRNRDENRTFKRFASLDEAVLAARVLVGGIMPNGEEIRYAQVDECDGRGLPKKRYAVAGLRVECWAEAEWRDDLQCWSAMQQHPLKIYQVEFVGGISVDVAALNPDDAAEQARSICADRTHRPTFNVPLLRVRLGGRLSHAAET